MPEVVIFWFISEYCEYSLPLIWVYGLRLLTNCQENLWKPLSFVKKDAPLVSSDYWRHTYLPNKTWLDIALIHWCLLWETPAYTHTRRSILISAHAGFSVEAWCPFAMENNEIIYYWDALLIKCPSTLQAFLLMSLLMHNYIMASNPTCGALSTIWLFGLSVLHLQFGQWCQYVYRTVCSQA